MGSLIVIAFVLLIGPIALFLGRDSRVVDTRDRRRWL
jgi:hypothetical protein